MVKAFPQNASTMQPSSSPGVLAIRDFRLFLCARFVSGIALQMINVGVGWQVYALTRDPLQLGYVGLAQFLPGLLLALPAGQVADRIDRRRILLACIGLQAVIALLLLLLSTRESPPLAGIYLALGAIGCTRAFLAPATQSVLPRLVPASLLSRAVALAASSWQAAVIVGPALGGVLYGVGGPLVFTSAMAAMVLAFRALWGLRTPLTVHSSEPVWQGVLGGVQFIFSRREILGAVSLDLFAVLLGGATALLPIFARDILDVGPWGLGLLRSAPAVGAGVMALVLVRYPLDRGIGRKLFFAIGLFGLATIIFALSTDVWLSLAALVLLGATDMVSVVTRQTLVQIRTPDAMRGRVSAVNWVFIGASNELGEFESGLTASWFGTVPAVVIGGLGTLLVAATWAWRFPELRRIDRLSS